MSILGALRRSLRERLARRLGVPEIPAALERLKQCGFQPRLIFDVGAYRGDFARDALRVWPGCRIACFEALEARVEELNGWAATSPNIAVFPCLVGAATRDAVPLNISETASSILSEHISQNFQQRAYQMRSIDDVIAAKFAAEAPDLLKIDVQGYELEVLKGAERTLPGIGAILVEVNLLDIHRDVPLIDEVIGWLAERHWAVYDICGLTRRPLDSALWQADLLFVPKSSDLRRDKRWAA